MASVLSVLKLRSHAPLARSLAVLRVQVAAYDFALNITTSGTTIASRPVCATALAAPLLLSGHRFDFGRFFIDAGGAAPEQVRFLEPHLDSSSVTLLSQGCCWVSV